MSRSDMAKGHPFLDNLSITLTHPHLNALDQCPFKGLCSSINNFIGQGANFLASFGLYTINQSLLVT